MKSESYKKWKEYFESADCSIYEIIANGIMVAAMDDPNKFREKRDQIGEKFYSAVKICESCSSYVVPDNHFKCETSGEFGTCELGFDQTSHFTIEETQELSEKIEEEQENLRHIFEIKKRLDNNEKEGEAEMVHLLNTLSLIVQSVEDLKSTQIRKTVSNLQYHWSSKVAEAARSTLKIFKKMIRDRASDNAAFAKRSKDREPHTNSDKTALPSVPIDAEINMCSIPAEDFSDFFYGMDHFDENARTRNNIGKFPQRQRTGPIQNKELRKTVPTIEGSASKSRNNFRKEKQQHAATSQKNLRPSQNKGEVENLLREELEPSSMIKSQKLSRKEANDKLTKRTSSRPSDTEFSLQRFKAYKMQMEAKNGIKNREQNDLQTAYPRASSSLTNQPPSDDIRSVDKKLESSKRKLQQGYQAHEKRRRITKYIPDVGNIPRDNSGSRTSRMWNRNNNRR